jgi:hypothetical protein
VGEERQVAQVGVPSMGQHRLRVTLILLLAAAIAACGGVSPSAVPSVVAGAAPTAVPGPTVSPVPGGTLSPRPGATLTAPSPSGRAPATITVEPGVEADGPGGTISDAIANAGVGPQLVNGIMLRAVDGSVWLCEVLLTSSPPQCAEPRLLVENRPQEDQTFVNGNGLHEADGVRWVENVQLFGIVRP